MSRTSFKFPPWKLTLLPNEGADELLLFTVFHCVSCVQMFMLNFLFISLFFFFTFVGLYKLFNIHKNVCQHHRMSWLLPLTFGDRTYAHNPVVDDEEMNNFSRVRFSVLFHPIFHFFTLFFTLLWGASSFTENNSSVLQMGYQMWCSRWWNDFLTREIRISRLLTLSPRLKWDTRERERNKWAMKEHKYLILEGAHFPVDWLAN